MCWSVKSFLTSQNANESIDSETGNMQTVVKDKNVTVCLWANFRRNPRWVREKMTIMELQTNEGLQALIEISHWWFRFKGFHFEEAGMGFELPKQLAVSDVAVRILHTRYDLLSLLVRVAHLGTGESPRYYLHFNRAKGAPCCIDLCCLFSPCSVEGVAEAPAPDADMTVEGEELKEEQQESKDGEDQTTQQSEGKKVSIVFWF